MARKAKDSRSVCIKMDNQVAERLDKFLEQTGLSKTKAIEKSVSFFLDAYEKTGKLSVWADNGD